MYLSKIAHHVCSSTPQIEEVICFVRVVDNTIRIQEETERVKEAMSRITAYNVVDIPHELRDVSTNTPSS